MINRAYFGVEKGNDMPGLIEAGAHLMGFDDLVKTKGAY
jgi:hypothetical protein